MWFKHGVTFFSFRNKLSLAQALKGPNWNQLEFNDPIKTSLKSQQLQMKFTMTKLDIPKLPIERQNKEGNKRKVSVT